MAKTKNKSSADSANEIEAAAARMILDRGVRYKIEEGDITIRPLRFGTVLMIAERAASAGLTEKAISEGENDMMKMARDYGRLMLECVAMAELNDRDALTEERIADRASWYADRLNAFQIYELFVHVLTLSGVQSFMNTIRLLLTMKEMNLSPRIKGS